MDRLDLMLQEQTQREVAREQEEVKKAAAQERREQLRTECERFATDMRKKRGGSSEYSVLFCAYRQRGSNDGNAVDENDQQYHLSAHTPHHMTPCALLGRYPTLKAACTCKFKSLDPRCPLADVTDRSGLEVALEISKAEHQRELERWAERQSRRTRQGRGGNGGGTAT